MRQPNRLLLKAKKETNDLTKSHKLGAGTRRSLYYDVIRTFH
jgi:hypothetical protein